MQQAFKLFDSNHDGKISRKELKSLIIRLGINLNESDIDNMIDQVDKNGDDMIEFDG